MARVLIVDDEPSLRRVLSVLLKESRHEVVEANGVGAAIEIIASKPLDLVITDQKMNDGMGMAVVSACRDVDSSLPVVMLTAYATMELAVESMRMGAFDFLTKPFKAEQVHAVVARACERTELRRQVRLLKGQLRQIHGPSKLVGESGAIKSVSQQIDRVAATNATVLLTGETGTGKELAARMLHSRSTRSAKPFVAINCAAISDQLFESELFGHERDGSAGEERGRVGLFESADQGTLFLDEIGDMQASIQAKILRVLNDGQIVRVGSRVGRTIDVRLVLATNRDLRQLVKAGQFREDLYFRINVVPIHMPALRDRVEDLAALVNYFLPRSTGESKSPPRIVSQAALAKLRAYDFPGNVRELRNLIERACILSEEGELGPHDFPLLQQASDEDCSGTPVDRYLASLDETLDLRHTLESLEHALIKKVLGQSDGVQAEAARRLGLSRSDLGYRLKRFAAQAPVSASPEA